MSKITDQARERMASRTPAETLVQMREAMAATLVRNAAILKQRMESEWADVTLAHEADKHPHRRKSDGA